MKRLASAFLLFFCASLQASACSCKSATLQEHARKADEIYIATLESASRSADGKNQPAAVKGAFAVTRTLKGPGTAKFLNLSTGTGEGDCGVPMMVSATYVIFRNRGDTVIDDCSGSAILNHFGPVSRHDEQEVEAAVKPVPQASKTKSGAR